MQKRPNPTNEQYQAPLPSAACRLLPASSARSAGRLRRPPVCNNEPKLLSLGMHEQEVPSATRDSGGTRYSDTDTG